MNWIKNILITFVLVFAGITISSALFITLFYPGVEISIVLLWEILIMSAVSSLGNLFFWSKYEISKNQMRIRQIIHYIYINVIVLAGAFLWKWITPGFLTQLIVMLVLIAAVYAGVMYFNLKKEKKVAEDLNQRLSQINTEEAEEEAKADKDK
jgi:uncharacterized membrane protein YfcA